MRIWVPSPARPTHLVDPLCDSADPSPRTICGRPVSGPNVHEVDEWPTCADCRRTLEKLQAVLSYSRPLRKVPSELVNPSDLVCPLCGEDLRVASVRRGFPTAERRAVVVSLHLICVNTYCGEAHGGPVSARGGHGAPSGGAAPPDGASRAHRPDTGPGEG